MKKSNQSKIGIFFKHYFGLLVLAMVCAAMAVLLIGYAGFAG